MNARGFSEALGELKDRFIAEALFCKEDAAKKRSVRIKCGAVAACLCLTVTSTVMTSKNRSSAVPSPDMVQLPNPIITVDSVEEMEKYLDFDVPLLQKDVEYYLVFVEYSYPTMGQIVYSDGSELRIKYGTGDISDIYGGAPEETKSIDGVNVDHYKYADLTYAVWEQNGYTFSYLYTDDSEADIETLIGLYN